MNTMSTTGKSKTPSASEQQMMNGKRRTAAQSKRVQNVNDNTHFLAPSSIAVIIVDVFVDIKRPINKTNINIKWIYHV